MFHVWFESFILYPATGPQDEEFNIQQEKAAEYMRTPENTGEHMKIPEAISECKLNLDKLVYLPLSLICLQIHKP